MIIAIDGPAGSGKSTVAKLLAKELNIEKIAPLDLASLDSDDDMLQKDKPTKGLLINKTEFKDKVKSNSSNVSTNTTDTTQKEYVLKFETPAPTTIENDYSTSTKFQRNVTVTHNSTLHYTDVRSFTDISEDLVKHNVDFKLYWNINETKTDVTADPRFDVIFVDTNGNGIADQMQWIVPKLQLIYRKTSGIKTSLGQGRQYPQPVQ